MTPTTSRLLLWSLAAAFMLPAFAAGALERVNFAKYQNTNASSNVGTRESSFATDGLVNDFNSFRTAHVDGPHWLLVNFGQEVTIGSAHLYLGVNNNPANILSHLKIQYRAANGNWIDIPGTERFGNTESELVIPFPDPVTSDRFRVFSNDDGMRAVKQFALFPPNIVGGVDQGYPIGTGVRLSLARQRPAGANSINGSNYPKHAFDGYVNNSARWLSNGNTSGEWIEVDLLENQVIGSAHVYSGWNETNAITDFDLRYWDGSSWQVIPGTTVTGNSSAALNLVFDSPVATSKVRLRTATASTARIKELLLFPPRSGGYPLGQDVKMQPPPSARWDDFSDNFLRLRNSGPDLRLGLVDDEVRFVVNHSPDEVLEWQLLLNYRDGSYRVRHVGTGQVLSQPGQNAEAGDPAIVEPYRALPWQDWILDFQSGGDFRLINAYSGLSLRSRGGLWEADNPIDLATPGPGALERWTAAQQRHHPKKGLAGWEAGYNQFNAYWSYRWSMNNPTWHPFWHSFNPMQWGGGNLAHGTSGGPLDRFYNSLQSSPKPTHLMGFNEPDQAGQANMTVQAAIDRWPRLEAMNVPLVAPGPASTFGGWLSSFSNQANALGYRRDYTAVHWYSSPSADSLITHLQQARNAFGRPVWLTEFSVVRWSGSETWTHRHNWNFLAEFMWRAESLPWLKRYSLFQFTEGQGGEPDPGDAPRSNTRSGGGLTPFGELYAGWDGDTNLRPYKAYHVQTRGEFERMQNFGDAAPVFTAPSSSGGWTQWMLLPAATPDRWRIVSLRDGRPLRVQSNQVVFGTPGQSDASAEWELVENQYGWFFIDHPQSGTRLRNLSSEYELVSPPGNYTGGLVQWRFAVPVSPLDASQPEPPPSLAAAAAPDSIELNWTASSSADIVAYSIHRGATSGGPYTAVATGVTGLTWTDAGLSPEETWHYVVTATNDLAVDSEYSAEVAATTPHPYELYSTWADETLPHEPGLDRSPDGDPDGDGLINLLEYGFLTDPLTANASPLRLFRDPDGTLRLEFSWNWRATDYTWRIRHGEDLSERDSWPVLDPEPVIRVPEGPVEHTTVTPDPVPPEKGFFILEMIPVEPL